MVWPPQSPDLNPIEQVWDFVKSRLEESNKVCLLTPPMSPFLYCLGALRALVLGNHMPPKRTDSSVPFQIVTRSTTRTVATPLKPARVVVPTTQVPSPSLRGGVSRLTYNLPVSATAVSRVPDMALPQDLIDALRNLTTAMGQDRLAAQNQAADLLNALDQQRQQSANLVQQLANNAAAGQNQQQQQNLPQAPVLPIPRIANAAVDSIPCFEGKLMDFPQDFIDFVDRVAVAEGWTDAQRIQVAARRLLKTALDWHIHIGHTHATWNNWSLAFTANFSPRLHVSEWLHLVEDRRQKNGESGIEYALDKHKVLRVAPIPLNEEKMVAFLIDGLASWQHVAAMTANRPANVTEFIQRIRELETLGVASRLVPPPAHGPVVPPWAPPVVPPAAPTATPPMAPSSAPDLNATLTAFGNQLVHQLTAQFNKMTIGSRGTGGGGGGGDRGGRSGGDRSGGGWVDPSKRKCYNCGVVGHISRHCPAKSGKGPTGS
ncbi:hypothetical protein OUZ56_021517 [Daphnia magna]|uniref:CCHC-type domain-containing protein n=1 Tax=Daphnia magna TaxID=35525 RepID=A0ABQ9ZHK5_9CRUS|nr:hypothetical protein OUZ56_021517 [Daphnia magna]